MFYTPFLLYIPWSLPAWLTIIKGDIVTITKPYIPHCLYVVLFTKFCIVDMCLLSHNSFLLMLYGCNIYQYCLLLREMFSFLQSNTIDYHLICSFTIIPSLLFTLPYLFTHTLTVLLNVILVITSFFYHQACYQNKPFQTWALCDVCTIHLLQLSSFYNIMPFSMYSISLCLHLFFCWLRIKDIHKYDQTVFYSAIPFGFDVLYAVCQQNAFLNVSMVSIVCGFMSIHFIRPFYNLSYVGCHFMITMYIYSLSVFINNK
jgi:hypothetical protein